EKLAHTEKALREADRRKDEFLAMLGHELRNPIASIRNSLFTITHAGSSAELAHRSYRIIDRQVTHLTRLVDDLLDITRIARGKIRLRREAVDLADLVRRAIDDQRATFAASGIRVDVRSSPGSYQMNADPARLLQVVSNLLGNAEKFTPRFGSVLV